jgi:hypothetical protein
MSQALQLSGRSSCPCTCQKGFQTLPDSRPVMDDCFLATDKCMRVPRFGVLAACAYRRCHLCFGFFLMLNFMRNHCMKTSQRNSVFWRQHSTPLVPRVPQFLFPNITCTTEVSPRGPGQSRNRQVCCGRMREPQNL